METKPFTDDLNDLRTAHSVAKERKEFKIYSEYNELIKTPGAMKSRVSQIISEKYQLRSNATLYNIRKRVEKRLLQKVVSA